MSPSIPLTKGQFTRVKVLSKLKEMASDRSICFKELLIVSFTQLAICKAARLAQLPPRAQNQASRIANCLVTGDTKLFRMSTTFRPKQEKMSAATRERLFESTRMAILNRRMAFQMLEPEQSRITLLGTWSDIKKSPLIYEIGSLKNYLKQIKDERSAAEATVR